MGKQQGCYPRTPFRISLNRFHMATRETARDTRPLTPAASLWLVGLKIDIVRQLHSERCRSKSGRKSNFMYYIQGDKVLQLLVVLAGTTSNDYTRPLHQRHNRLARRK